MPERVRELICRAISVCFTVHSTSAGAGVVASRDEPLYIVHPSDAAISDAVLEWNGGLALNIAMQDNVSDAANPYADVAEEAKNKKKSEDSRYSESTVL